MKIMGDMSGDLWEFLQCSSDGYSIVDGNGTILYRNKVMERLTGVSDEKAVGCQVQELRASNEYGPINVISGIELCIKTKEPVTLTFKNYLSKLLLTHWFPILHSDGSIKRIICVLRDLTEFTMLQAEVVDAHRLKQEYRNKITSLQQEYYKRKKTVYSSKKMQDLMDYVVKIASVDATVLITGESGTGKEMVAETIHSLSNKRLGPFIAVNCGSIPSGLFESELFGYEPGAFTGARKEGKPGFFELAENGTLFLDEIGEIPYSLQVKLLRVLQNRDFVRVGGSKIQKTNARIIAATNRDLLKLVQEGHFREDLYYRLNVIPVEVPPLRERIEDIPALTNYFLLFFNRKYNTNKGFDTECMNLFRRYKWPGNVRELEHLIENLAITCPTNLITKDYLPDPIKYCDSIYAEDVFTTTTTSLQEILDKVEKKVIEQAYLKYKHSRDVASVLNISLSTLMRKVKKHGITLTKYGEV